MGLKEMEVRKKLEMSADEGLVIESFKHPLPCIFNNGSSTSSTMVWLPGIPTKDKWMDDLHIQGAKLTIEDKVEVIWERMEVIIEERLGDHQEAYLLAWQLLSDTITFLTALSWFMSDTYAKLETSSFNKDNSWKLVSKLVHRIFATDCHLKRGMVSKILDATNARILAIGENNGSIS